MTRLSALRCHLYLHRKLEKQVSAEEAPGAEACEIEGAEGPAGYEIQEEP